MEALFFSFWANLKSWYSQHPFTISIVISRVNKVVTLKLLTVTTITFLVKKKKEKVNSNWIFSLFTLCHSWVISVISLLVISSVPYLLNYSDTETFWFLTILFACLHAHRSKNDLSHQNCMHPIVQTLQFMKSPFLSKQRSSQRNNFASSASLINPLFTQFQYCLSIFWTIKTKYL